MRVTEFVGGKTVCHLILLLPVMGIGLFVVLPLEVALPGICQLCGQQIPRRRLEVVPDAALCLSCQEKAEQVRREGSTG